MGFVATLVSQQGHLVHKISGKEAETGRSAYYFVLVTPDKEAPFLTALENEKQIDLAAYGKIVASCYGEEPSNEVKTYLKEEYGFDI